MKYTQSIGKTHEGRDMPAVKLTASTDPNRKKVYMQCQIHAREYTRTHKLINMLTIPLSLSPVCLSHSFCSLSLPLHLLLLHTLEGEWISGSVCMYIVEHLVNGYGNVQNVTDILNKVEILVIPFVNPDGYVVSDILCSNYLLLRYTGVNSLVPSLQGRPGW